MEGLNVYNHLQNSIDKVVGKIGVKQTIHLLDNFINNVAIDENETKKVKMVTDYLVVTAIKVFNLDEEIFYTSQIKEYKEARMCCYHLLKKYTEASYANIGHQFKQKKRNAVYGHVKIEECLSVPHSYSRLLSNHAIIEAKLIEFISKINFN